MRGGDKIKVVFLISGGGWKRKNTELGGTESGHDPGGGWRPNGRTNHHWNEGPLAKGGDHRDKRGGDSVRGFFMTYRPEQENITEKGNGVPANKGGGDSKTESTVFVKNCLGGRDHIKSKID